MKTILVSACLLGFNCKYSGGSNALPADVLTELKRKFRLIPVCPEVAGGLPVPREPSERRGEAVVSRAGTDVTEQYLNGAGIAVKLYERFACSAALLKERSPSCGPDGIYDGSFTGTVIPARGTAAEVLSRKGAVLYGESQTDLLNKEN